MSKNNRYRTTYYQNTIPGLPSVIKHSRYTMKHLNNNAKSFMEYLNSITGMDTIHGKTVLSGED